MQPNFRPVNSFSATNVADPKRQSSTKWWRKIFKPSWASKTIKMPALIMIEPGLHLNALLLGLTATLVAAVVPAWRMMRMSVVRALGYV